MGRENIYNYGNHTPYEMENFWMGDGQLHGDKLKLGRPAINEDDYQAALEDVNQSWGVINDPKTKKTFEVARANLSAPLDWGLDAEMSTFTSSISGNPGNAVEFAENAALRPDKQRLYIASFGNGASVYWTSQESRHIRRTGSFTQEDGRPLPTLEALQRALKASDFIINRLSTNSMGGAYATGLMTALPEGQVSRAYMKSRPNITNHRNRLLWGLGILVHDVLDDRKYQAISKDPWRLKSELIKNAKDGLPNIYSKKAQNNHRTLMQKAASSHAIKKMLSDMVAMSKGGWEKDYPAGKDTTSALRQQPEVLMTYHFPMQDRLYSENYEGLYFLRLLYYLGQAAVGDGQVEVLIAPGRHRDHTQYPGLRWAAETHAFNRSA